MLVGVLLARVLAPRDFGVFAVALVAYLVVINVSELGVSVALVRHPDEGPQLGPTVWTLALVWSLLLTGGLWLAAPLAAAQLGTPEASGVLRALCLAVLVAGISAVPSAVVQRDFQQNWRFAADSVNLLVSTGVAVSLAFGGGGAYALAWSRVAGNAASAVIFFVAAKERYRPGFDRRVAARLLRFGCPLAGASLLAFALLNVDYVVVGRMWGPVALGFYVLAFNLSGWPVAAFSTMARSVALPAFARLRSGPEQRVSAFVSAFGTLLAASLAVSVLLVVLAGPTVDVVYGRRWAAAAVPLMYLASLGTFRVLHELSYDYLVAAGRTGTVMVVQAVWLAGLLVALPVGSRLHGIAGVGAGHLLVAVAVLVPAYGLALRRAGVGLTRLCRASVRPLTAAALSGAVCLGLAGLLRGQLVTLLVAGTCGALAYLAVVAPALPAPVASLSPQALLRAVAGRVKGHKASGPRSNRRWPASRHAHRGRPGGSPAPGSRHARRHRRSTAAGAERTTVRGGQA